MKKNSWLIVSLIFLSFTACQEGPVKKESPGGFVPHPLKLEERKVETLKIGDAAPDFSLPDTEGRFHTLDDYREAEVFVVIFSCNHCPTAQEYEDRIISFVSDYKDRGVSLVVISAASIYGILPEEQQRTDLDDSYESMQIRARDKKFNFPYLYDGDNHAASIKFGPTASPHTFVFNKDRKLEYVGRLDASEEPGAGRAEDLRAAVDAVLKGEKPEVAVNKAFGCSTKWSWRNNLVEKGNERWAAKEVGLNTIDTPGIAELRNTATEKLLLIYLWSTKTDICEIEYPKMVVLQRNFGARAFELVSISADDPKNVDEVFGFLKSNHSAVQNFLFDETDKSELIKAIDPAWNGSLPYAILIEPGGEVIYSHQGEVNQYILKKTIVDHPLLGRAR